MKEKRSRAGGLQKEEPLVRQAVAEPYAETELGPEPKPGDWGEHLSMAKSDAAKGLTNEDACAWVLAFEL